MRKFLISVISASVLAIAQYAAAAPLFATGKSSWKICLDPASGAVEKYAARELQYAIQKISGATIPIVSAASPGRSDTVFIGSLSATEIKKRAAEFGITAGNHENIAVKNVNGNLFLAGNSPRAALFAVYRFLQKELGVRYLWAGPSGEFFPERAEYNVPDKLSDTFTPPLLIRELNPCGLGRLEEHEIFLVRNFNNATSRTPSVLQNTGTVNLARNHWVFPDKKWFDKNPELFALYDGKRITHGEGGCWSNPEFQRRMIEKLVKIAKEHKLDLMNAFPADSTLRCSCAKCTATPGQTDRWFDTYAKLVDGVKKQLPNLRFAGIAYQEYRPAPDKKVNGLEYVEYCQYDRCYVHPFNHAKCKLNTRSLNSLKQWQSKAPMGIYGYEFDIYTGKSSAMVPFWNILADAARYYAQNNVRHVMTEAWIESPKDKQRADLFQQKQRLNYYIYSQMLFDPSQKVEDLLSGFCRAAYGPAAAPMEAYFKAMAAAWEKMPIHMTYFHNDSAGTARHFLNPALIKFAETKLNEAKNLAAASPRVREEIEIDRKHFEQWRRNYLLTTGVTKNCAVPQGNNFDHALIMPFQTRGGDKTASAAKIYYDRDNLHIAVDCAPEAGAAKLRRGLTGRDGDIFMDDAIEIFLDLNDGDSYRHFAFNAAGGTYDARGMDSKWNPAWQVKTSVKPDGKGWNAVVTIPFASLGGMPGKDSVWRFIIVRSEKPEAAGFPIPAFHDLASGANLYFAPTALERNMTWFVKDKEFMEQYLEPLSKAGWSYKIVRHKDLAKPISTAGDNLIVWSTHENALPMDFFQKQILERVKNGAALICHQYGPCHYEKYFQDPSFKVGWSSSCDKLRKTTSLSASRFLDYPDNLRKMLGYTPPLVLLPAMPENWEIVAMQKNSQGEEKPYILLRRYGKGVVIINASMRATNEMIARFNNAAAYVK